MQTGQGYSAAQWQMTAPARKHATMYEKNDTYNILNKKPLGIHWE